MTLEPFNNEIFNNLNNIRNELCCVASEGVAYYVESNRDLNGGYVSGWEPSFTIKNIREVWVNENATMRTKREFILTTEQFWQLSELEMDVLGFGNWDDNVRLIPLWAFNYIADGTSLTCISGEVKTKGQDEIGTDVRWGCIAYGFNKEKSL